MTSSRSRADYHTIIDDDRRVICIVDDGGDVSVTNQIELIVADLFSANAQLNRYDIVYRDSEGRWDGVLQRDGVFRSFKPIGARDREEAIRRAIAGRQA